MRKIFFITIVLLCSFQFENYSKNYTLMEGEQYVAFAEEMPSPLGGIEGIYRLIKYPTEAIKNKTEGKVYVLAFINEDGNVDDVKVVKGIGSGCDEATIDAVKKSKFSPGKSGGKSIKVKMSLQIQFKIS